MILLCLIAELFLVYIIYGWYLIDMELVKDIRAEVDQAIKVIRLDLNHLSFDLQSLNVLLKNILN